MKFPALRPPRHDVQYDVVQGALCGQLLARYSGTQVLGDEMSDDMRQRAMVLNDAEVKVARRPRPRLTRSACRVASSTASSLAALRVMLDERHDAVGNDVAVFTLHYGVLRVTTVERGTADAIGGFMLTHSQE